LAAARAVKAPVVYSLAVQIYPCAFVEGFSFSVVEGIAVLYLEVLLFSFVVFLVSQLVDSIFLVVYTLAKQFFSPYDRDQTVEV
jgi:hypothetical protein